MTDAFRDQEARVLAATHFGQNLVVEAGAGTGKTSLLVERALNLHLSSTCNLRDQVIITFTNKAAAELKFRIAKALSEITEAQDSLKTSFSEAGRSYRWLTEEQGIDPEKLKPLARQALRELEQTSIQTIHAYCSSILRRHPMEAKLPPDYVPDEGEARKILLEEFWPEFMANELGKDGKNHDRWFQILQEFPQEEVQHVARAFVQTPLALNMLVREGYKTIDPKVFYAQEHTAYQNWLEGALPALTGESKLKEMVETQIRMLKVLEHGGLSALQNFPEDQVRPGTFWSVSKIYALPKDLQKDPAWEGFQDELKVIRDHLKFLANKLDPRNLETLMKGIAIFADAFDKESARIGAPALDDLLLRARNLLQDHPDVRDQEMQRAKAILLDEFQDTDPLQYDIVFLLASGKEYGDLIPGKLFIVGDPKQSIYRFRGADIRAYQRTVAHIVECGGRALSLTTNFRSLPEVLAPLNKVFGPWMGDDPESPNYQPLNAARKPSSESAAVEVWHVGLSGEASVRERREAEAKVLASSLAKWQREGRYAFRDMAILFRALTEVAIYTRALREEGIDYVVDGGKMFTNRPEVTEALTLLRALANPADRVAALGVLRCSVGGVTDGDLYAFRQAGGSFIWRSAEATEAYREEHPSVVQTFDWLRELDKKTRDLPIDRRILQILTEGDFPILMASYFEGAQRVANVKKLAYRAADMARERMFSLDETVQALEREFGDDYNEGESPLADEAADSVRILSIHAAKGLEFPLVCLADLRPDQPRGAYGAKVRVVHHQGKDYLGVSNRGKPDLPSHIAQKEDGEQDVAEGKRLMYVATTRAKDHLVVLLNQKPEKIPFLAAAQPEWDLAEGGDVEPGTNLERHGVQQRWINYDPATRVTTESLSNFDVSPVYRYREAKKQVSQIPRLTFRTPSEHEQEQVERTGSKTRPELAKRAGVLVHATLESWDYASPEDLRKQSQRLLDQVRISAILRDELKSEVDRILSGFLESDLLSHLSRQNILGREVPLIMQGTTPEETVHGYIDLVYEDKEGYVVADFKTDDTNNPKETAEAYRSQLTDYAHALKKALKLSALPRREVLFLRTGERIRLSG